MRIGGESLYRFVPDLRVSPWVGLGAGYAKYSVTSPPATLTTNGTTVTVAGLGWRVPALDLVLQAGGDFRLLSMLSVGPYVTFLTGIRPGGQPQGNVPALEAGLRLVVAP